MTRMLTNDMFALANFVKVHEIKRIC